MSLIVPPEKKIQTIRPFHQRSTGTNMAVSAQSALIWVKIVLLVDNSLFAEAVVS